MSDDHDAFSVTYCLTLAFIFTDYVISQRRHHKVELTKTALISGLLISSRVIYATFFWTGDEHIELVAVVVE